MERIPERLTKESRRRHEKRRKRRQARFVKGPLPVHWLRAAVDAGGKALAVGLALWFESGLTGKRDGLRMTPRLLNEFGVSRKAAYLALTRLESADLISVKRHRGRAPRVTIIEQPGRGVNE